MAVILNFDATHCPQITEQEWDQLEALQDAQRTREGTGSTAPQDGPQQAAPQAGGADLSAEDIAKATAQDAIAKAMASIDQGLKDQRFRFKQIGEGAIEIQEVKAPTMSLNQMIQSLVFIASKKTMVAFREMPAICVPPDVMGALLVHNKTEIDGKNPGEKIQVPTFSLWRASEKRLVTYTETFDPKEGEFCNDPDGLLALNLWKPKSNFPPNDWATRIGPFLGHVKYLVPVQDERERFLDWLAHIQQKPGELPHSHYLMIATSQGVGRNWLASLMACMWSGHVALDYDLIASLKTGFNGQLSRKLLAVVDEINEGGGLGAQWKYAEKLKSMVTTSVRAMNPKFGLQYSEVNCCRWLLFSNYESALPLHSDDRRWNIIRNPSEPKDADYYSVLYKTLGDSKFVSSVREFLLRRDISAFNPSARAIMNEAKEGVIQASVSIEDELASELVETYPRDLVFANEMFHFIYKELPDHSSECSRRWKLLGIIAAKAGIEPLPKSKDMTLFGKRLQKIWILRNHANWKQARSTAVEAELAKN